MQSANLSGPFRGCLYYALLGLPQATGLAGGYDYRNQKREARRRRKRRNAKPSFGQTGRIPFKQRTAVCVGPLLFAFVACDTIV